MRFLKPYQQTRISKFINSHGTPVVFFVYKRHKKKKEWVFGKRFDLWKTF